MSYVCELILLDMLKNPGTSSYWMRRNRDKSKGTFIFTFVLEHENVYSTL
jgi:hypothetical protein